jgi:hypothetical protein
MKKIISFLPLLFIVFISSSCNNKKEKIQEVKLIPVKTESGYQYINTKGEIIIPARFRQATVFREGAALVLPVEENPQWGYISENGEYIIHPQYQKATVFNEGLAWVILPNSAPQAINIEGKVEFTLPEANHVYIFKEHLAAFSTQDNNIEKWGFVDKKGKIRINPRFMDVMEFSEGLCAVKNDNQKWGYTDPTGNMAIKYQFDYAGSFRNGKAIVQSGNKYGVINKKGEYILNPQFNEMGMDNDIFIIERNKQWGWVNKDGKDIIPPQFDGVFPFLDNEITSVRSGEYFGFINKKGQYVVNPQFNIALPFNGPIALVVDSGKTCFIDKTGKIIIEPCFQDFSFDYFLYVIDGSCQYESVAIH